MSRKVLIIDDDPTFAALIAYNLTDAGYETQIASNGEDGLNAAMSTLFDIIVMDVMLLGDYTGYEVLRKLRQRNTRVPVMLLTAKKQEEDIVEGLDAGADDYMAKPFSTGELLARIAAVIRRSADPKRIEPNSPYPNKLYQFGKMTVYPDKYEVEMNGVSQTLRPKEFEVLLHLVQKPGSIVSRDTLLNTVWGVDYIGGQRTVDVHISALRKKLELNQTSVSIESIRGIGYRLLISPERTS